MPFIPSTSELLDANKLLLAADIRQGMKVADLGCGTTGHFVFAAAELVGPDGMVYAVDIQQGALGGVESRKKLEAMENVKTVWADIERYKGIRIPDASLDLVLLINNLFLAKQKSEMAREILRIMSAGATLVVADWKTTQAPFGPPVQDRVSAEEAKKVFVAAGFSLKKEFEAGAYHYGLIFNKLGG